MTSFAEGGGRLTSRSLHADMVFPDPPSHCGFLSAAMPPLNPSALTAMARPVRPGSLAVPPRCAGSNAVPGNARRPTCPDTNPQGCPSSSVTHRSTTAGPTRYRSARWSASAWTAAEPRRLASPAHRPLARSARVAARGALIRALAAGGSEPPPPPGGPPGGGGGGGSGDDGPSDSSDEPSDFSAAADPTPLNAAAAEARRLALGAPALPADLAAAAASPAGLRSGALTAWSRIALGRVPGGALATLLAALSPAVRDRLIADPRFLFKVFAEVLIDTACCTVAEVRKRGPDFWDEFDFYLSDIVVGIVLDAVLVTLMAPRAALAGGRAALGSPAGGRLERLAAGGGALAAPARATRGLQALSRRLPSAVFAPSVPGLPPYSLADRGLGFAVKGAEYALAGILCGLCGQGATNVLLLARAGLRSGGAGAVGAAAAGAGAGGGPLEAVGGLARAAWGSFDEGSLPPVGRTSLVWGLFMSLSSNGRYQVVYGLERAMELTPWLRHAPALLNLGSVAVRLTNNVIGGEQFIDMARWAGVQ